MIKKIGKHSGFICSKCGNIISDDVVVDAIEYSDICTACIDRKFKRYRVAELTVDDLRAMGYDTADLSDDRMAEIADTLKSNLLISPYWDALDKTASEMELGKLSGRKGHGF
jgi:hypothetical protein